MKWRIVRPWAALLVTALLALPVGAQAEPWTLEQALARAREQGAATAEARGRLEEARARLARAGRRFQENPVLELNGGHRVENDVFDFEAAVTQDLLAGGKRDAGRAAALAAVERAEADLEEAGRQAGRAVAAAFLRALAARERTTLLARSREAADGLLAAEERRSEAGEATALELNRARTAAAGARAAEREARAAESEAGGDLAALLGLSRGAVEAQGSLAPAQTSVQALIQMPGLADLLARLDRRPDLRALAADLHAAEAEVALGRALARPVYGLRGGVGRDDGADLWTAGVVIALPVHDRGELTLTAGQARAAAVERSLAAARAAAEAEVRSRHAALGARLAAVGELETTALPALDDNESLALASFEAGEIDLGELLLIRREILETRLAYLDRQLAAALTQREAEAAAGVLP